VNQLVVGPWYARGIFAGGSASGVSCNSDDVTFGNGLFTLSREDRTMRSEQGGANEMTQSQLADDSFQERRVRHQRAGVLRLGGRPGNMFY